jgi:diadenosine tetraphosphate (Ap4A) HIT family hydrolase
MTSIENCAFCDPEAMAWRTIRSQELFTSFVSKPWFRAGQCLVIPNRHVVTVGELSSEEGAAVMGELGRLSIALDRGHGSGVMQKYQPTQAENGVKMNHLHFHVFPRIEDETGIFPVPEPNDFDGFIQPNDAEVLELAAKLK